MDKVCSRCKTPKDLSEFNSNKSKHDRKQAYCKTCQKSIGDDWLSKNRGSHLNSTLLRNYGITLEDYKKILESQEGVCGICGGSKVSRTFGMFHIDHCHITNKVRGLLCSECNTGLGKLGDTVESLEKALDYLKRTS